MLPTRIRAGRRTRRRLAACAAAAGAAALVFGAAGVPAKAASSLSAPINLCNYQTGLCVDSNYAGNAYTLSWNGGNYQYWWPTYTGLATGAITWQDAQTGRCLDSNYNGNLYTSPCNYNNTYQNWWGG